MLAYFNTTVLLVLGAYVAGAVTGPKVIDAVRALLAKIGSKI